MIELFVQNASLLILALFIMAFLYSSVGHGGASGYLAVMALFSIAPAVMKQSALILNLGVSMISFLQFYRKGFFKWRNFWPFALASIPMSYLGSLWILSDSTYKKVLAICLFFAVLRIMFQQKTKPSQKQVPLIAALMIGAIIGLISGMIGIGGGILLSPLILLFAWANMKETAAVSALFIFVNSLAGLIAVKNWVALEQQNFVWMILASLIGGILGSSWGANYASSKWIKYILGLVLIIASLKLFFV
ncbi:MAG: sulfite exporter TauE/SafE family protein [Aquirufa sp.]